MTTIHTRQLTTIYTRQLTKIHTRQLTIHTRQLTTIHTRQLTTIHARQLTIHTRQLTTIYTRQLTTIHTRQLTIHTRQLTTIHTKQLTTIHAGRVSRRDNVDVSENKKSLVSIENRNTTHLSSTPQSGQRSNCNLNSEDITRGRRYSNVCNCMQHDRHRTSGCPELGSAFPRSKLQLTAHVCEGQ